jgi:hypothetical protein
MNKISVFVAAFIISTMFFTSTALCSEESIGYPSRLYLNSNYSGLTRFYGVNQGDLTGSTIASGDVNGDGRMDVIAGAIGASSVINRPESGAVYIIYGHDGFFESLSIDPVFDTEHITLILGFEAFEQLGYRITCGDIDNDGCDDIVIGATGATGQGIDGKVYVVKGAAYISEKKYIDLFYQQTDVVTINSNSFDNQFGYTCSLGDYNGDRFDDIMIGAPKALSPLNELRSGVSFFIPGSASFFTKHEIQIDSVDNDVLTVSGKASDDEFGIGAASGDYNGDGYSDIAVGAWKADRQSNEINENEGKVYILWGSPLFFQINDYVVESSQGFQTILYGEQGMLGHNISSGDLNSDGIADMVIGAHTYSQGKSEAGALYCVYGNAYLPELSVFDLTHPSERFLRVVGATAGDHTAIGMIADVDNDGVNDLVAGSPEAYFSGDRYGMAYVLFGPLSVGNSTIDMATTRLPFTRIISSEYPRSGFCRNNMIAGDINGDGKNDLILPCVLGYDSDYYNPGKGLIYFLSGDQSEYGSIMPPVVVADKLQKSFTLSQNYPNPFNPITTIPFEIAERGRVTVEIFNVLGEKVATIIDEVVDAGSHEVTWDARNCSAGVYFYRLRSGTSNLTNRMILLK